MKRPLPFAFLAALFVEGGMFLSAILLAVFFDRHWSHWFQWDFINLVTGIAFSIPIYGLFRLLWEIEYEAFRRIRSYLETDVTFLFSGCRNSEIFLIALLAGVGEEFFFRGFLLELISDKFGVGIGLLTTSVAFGLVHFITGTYAIIAALIGIYFGLLAQYFQNLLVPSLAHAIYDYAALYYLLHRKHPLSG